jgi:hypothetical protein
MYSTPEQRRKHVEEQRKYRLAHPEAVNASRRKWSQQPGFYALRQAAYKANNPEKFRARNVVTHAIRDGKLIRPSRCSLCLLECKPQAHHEDYSKPLDVVWLCRPCHAKEDGRQARVYIPGDPQ